MYAVYQDQGLREYMEDFVDVSPSLYDNYSYYAVFDGHGGKEVAMYLQTNLAGFVKDNLVSGMGPKESLLSAFEIAADNIDALNVGSTALVVLINPNGIWVANTGDCRAVLNKFENFNYKGIAVTEDHKPNKLSEQKRIKEAGGNVVHDMFGVPRVNGYLAVSRSFGDLHLAPSVTWQPEIYYLPRTEEMRALILASDGLWDVMTNQEVVNIATDVINKMMTFDRSRTLQLITKEITKNALDKGASDNISVIFIVV